jgi:hypothetical protein
MSAEFPNPSADEKTLEEHDFSNGCTVKANKDIPALGISKDMVLPLTFNGTYLAAGPLTWDVDQLKQEIKAGVWTLESVP